MQRAVGPVPSCGSAILLGAALVAWTSFPAWSKPTVDEVIYQSPDVKIYRTLDRQGNPTLVLTNLDEKGHFLPGHQSDPGGSRGGCREAPRPSAPNAAAEPMPGPVRVTVIDGNGEERPAGEGEVEARGDEAGGTTIVININNNPPAPPAAAPIIAYPVAIYGGLAGPFRYPEHHHFLGYGHGTGSPSLFSGLGLNAGNRFGWKNGNTCDRGYDCLFGPEGEHP